MVLAAADGKLQPRSQPSSQPSVLRSDPYGGTPRYEAVQQFIANPDVDKIFATLKAGGLRGMGGAGFPTGDKWRFVRMAQSDVKYIVVNADESEPGTIKDRFIMESVPYLMLEGMIIAGMVTGAKKGFVYLRHEYEGAKEATERAIHDARQKGVLGPKVMGSNFEFDIEVFISPGGYICGEESALLEAMEGKRAEPRNKPPFPGVFGLYGKPTVINNVETMAFVPPILLKGADWWKAQGKNGGSGMKFVGISGHVARPGVYEVPMGTTYEDAIYKLAGGIRAGKKLKAFCPSGPLAGILPASMINLTLDPKTNVQNVTTLGSGAIVAIAEPACVVDLALNLTRFYRNESCGKCVPCRTGSQKIVDIIYGVTQGSGGAGDLNEIERLSEAMMMASICGLGQVAVSPALSLLRGFEKTVPAT